MAVAGAQDFVPASGDLEDLAAAVQGCRGCDLYREADQAVFGAGSPSARVMLVGEVPGDQEDRVGSPFVGPAGKLLDKALVSAGIDREGVYVTNAVKHFKFTRAGKRRIHKTPSRTEVVACRPWLIAELTAVQPDLLVLLGATAAKSLLGSEFRITAHRGQALRMPADGDAVGSDIDPHVVATVHPSSVLRGPPEDRERAFAALVADLRFAAGLVS
ncbi:MAG: UdgX family uracil-DNA binding protein [Mycobacterium sp.]